ncbi:MAG TPA: asparagine synthase (glutamine-hydrolyzing) [Nitrospiria bacterium]|nr:asparagine synthase (glutamine-hydrolyzing) [Nitrospiria bacterium]
MCGIGGICAFSGDAVDEAVLRRMMAALRHRGPDDDGYYLSPGRQAALGHRRLSVIDLSSGRQPIFNRSGEAAVVFNGEIYNFHALRETLERKGFPFRTRTDTEVIIHLYDELGADCVRELHGMFAFAIWDDARRMLLLARDRIGKKPLHYAVLNGTLYFASEIQALYGLPGLPGELDEVALDLFLTHGYIPSPRTIYRRIKKLPPAHLLIFTKDGPSLTRYWRPEFARTWPHDYESAKQELARLAEEAVRSRLISDVPLGAFLSGGIDSSTVVALMSRLSSKPVKTFSIGFANGRYNELPHARTVAGRYGTEHHEFVVEPKAMELLPEIVRHYGEPYGDSSALPTWHLSKMTRRHVTVALNGDGGDELFGGYPWYRWLRLLRAAEALTGPALPRVFRAAAGGLAPRRLGKVLELIAAPEAERFWLMRACLTREERRRLYHPDVLTRIDDEASAELASWYDGSIPDADDRAFAVDLQVYLPEDLLVKVDRASMAHALECRSPLLDHRVVEFACSLPPEWKLEGRTTKKIFRETFGPLFPAGFFDRPKQGFAVPVGEWLRGELRGYWAETVLRGPLSTRPLLNLDEVGVLMEEHARGVRNREAILWNCLMLSLWFEAYGAG